MRKKFLKFLALSIVLVSLAQINSFCESINIEQTNTLKEDVIKNDTLFKSSKNIEFIDGIYGIYNSYDSGTYDPTSSIYVFRENENHIRICGYFYRSGYFCTNPLEIKKNRNNEIIATMNIDPSKDDNYDMNYIWYLIAKKQNLDNFDCVKMDILFKDNELNLKFNNSIQWKCKKNPVKCITEETKNIALNNILDSNFIAINEDIFEIIHDTDNYLVVRVKTPIQGNCEYFEEGSIFGMYKYYNIEKKTKKILKLDDIIKDSHQLNEYIINLIQSKRGKWIAIDRSNYKDFTGIGTCEWLENYFKIDEDKNTVRIRCLSYPCEANRAMGDLDLSIPFSFFNLNGTSQENITNDSELFAAVVNNNHEKVKTLIESGANVNAKDAIDYSTPLHLAHNIQIAKLLIDNGADVNAKDDYGYTPLYLACRDANLDIARFLINNGADVNVKDSCKYSLLYYTCSDGNLDIAELLIANGADVNAKDCFGQTLLYLACRNSNLDIAKLLIDNGADVNAKDNSGLTPLVSACSSGNLDIVKLLIKRGAYVNVYVSNNRHSRESLLHWCFDNDKSDIAKLLIENGAQ